MRATWKRVASSVFAGLVLASATTAVRAAEEGSDRAAAIAAARDMVAALREATGAPGVSVAVGRRGEIVWSEGFGLADLENRVPVTAATRFRAASVSKVLTVAALARLADRGVLDLDAPIRTLVPAYANGDDGITLRRLAGHLAGIRHYRPADFENDRRHFDSLIDALAIFQHDPLVAPPGAQYRYSTFGYTLIGAAIEAATGESFLDVMEAEVFAPLGMRASGGDVRRAIVPGRTAFYRGDAEGEVANAPEVDPSYKWPGGGLLTTPEDLVRFGMAHLEDGLISAAQRDQLFAGQRTADGQATGVGIGWRIGEDWRGRRIFHHSGSMYGSRSSIVLYPDSGWVLALMTNLWGMPPWVERSLQLLAEAFLGPLSGMPAPAMPAGSFHWSADLDGTEDRGVLELVATDRGPRGLLSVPTPMRERLARNELPTRPAMAIVGALAGADGPVLVLATPFGLLEVPVTIREDGLSLRLGLGRQGTLELSAIMLD